MVGPIPAHPTAWEFVVEQEGRLRHGTFDWLDSGSLAFSGFDRPPARTDELWPEIERSGQSTGFLSWARLPWLEADSTETGRRVHLMDARYVRSRTRGFGGTVVTLPRSAGGVSTPDH